MSQEQLLLRVQLAQPALLDHKDLPGGNPGIATSYTRNDAGAYNGASYVSLILSNIGQPPDSSPTNWIAQAGAIGSTGLQGPAGPRRGHKARLARTE